MASPPRIPPELGDHIIDYLSDSPPALRACSLTCTRFLPWCRHYLFRRVTVRPTPQFLAFLRAPSKLVPTHAEILDFHLWPSEMDEITTEILGQLINTSRVKTIILGPSPPLALNFPNVTKLSLQHSIFSSCNDFACFLLNFPALRELELKWVTWAGSGDKPVSEVGHDLDFLSVQGLQANPDILPWLSCPEFGPRTRELSLSLPTHVDPNVLSALSQFFHHLDGHLQHLQLDVYPSVHLERACPPYFRWSKPNLNTLVVETIALLKIDSITSLRRLRIGRGLYFSIPGQPAAPPTFRTFPRVLKIAPRLVSKNRLAELIFDVEIGPPLWLSGADSDSRLTEILATSGVEKIPKVGFHILPDRETHQVVDVRQRQLFAAFIRKRGFLSGRDVVCYDDFTYTFGTYR
ncbi:hypothetical protein C8R47DRAFT_1193129 [Mycena vitilis]|nr:hypothetical protein C8R47DRAFT_1193129 [Mycena vitilis]